MCGIEHGAAVAALTTTSVFVSLFGRNYWQRFLTWWR
jgi:hypothetical protein